MAKHSLRLAIVSLLSLVLSACDGSSNSAPGEQQTQAEAQSIQLRMQMPFLLEGTSATVTAILNRASETDVTLLWEALTAKGNLDADSGALIIPAGQTTGAYEIRLPENAVYEGARILSMRVSDQAGTFKLLKYPLH